MILISHRGNINGRIPERENTPDYIDEAIAKGYDVEIDLWAYKVIAGPEYDIHLWLGHDQADTKVELKWLLDRRDSLWIHCKNFCALSYFTLKIYYLGFNAFHHESDEPYVLTTNGSLWAYPGYEGDKNTICLLPEYYPQNLDPFKGICSDYIGDYYETGTIRPRRSSD